MYTENVEKIFYQDIRDKRKSSSGAFHKKGHGVISKSNAALRTPYHFMSNKERKKLNSEVVTTFMYETVITRNEFELKDKETQKAMMLKWRELYSNAHIMKEMGITGNATFAKIVNDLELPKKLYRKGRKAAKPKTEQLSLDAVKESTQEMVISNVPSKLIMNGLALEYNGTYEAEAINKILTKVQLLLDGEVNKFEVHISVVERG